MQAICNLLLKCSRPPAQQESTTLVNLSVVDWNSRGRYGRQGRGLDGDGDGGEEGSKVANVRVRGWNVELRPGQWCAVDDG